MVRLSLRSNKANLFQAKSEADSGGTSVLHPEVIPHNFGVQTGKPRPALGFFQANVAPLRAGGSKRLTLRMHRPTCSAPLRL